MTYMWGCGEGRDRVRGGLAVWWIWWTCVVVPREGALSELRILNHGLHDVSDNIRCVDSIVVVVSLKLRIANIL